MAQTTMYPGHVNSPATTLSAGITNVATTIGVTELGVFPAATNIAVIGTGSTAETILYTGKSAASGAGNLTGCTRGWNVTGSYGAAKAWNSGDPIRRSLTEYDYNTLKLNITDLDGRLPGAWTAYDPTWTFGGGTPSSPTKTGRYCQIGKTVHFNCSYTSADSNAGTLSSISLPVNASASAAIAIATFFYKASSTPHRAGVGIVSASGTTITFSEMYTPSDGVALVFYVSITYEGV